MVDNDCLPHLYRPHVVVAADVCTVEVMMRLTYLNEMWPPANTVFLIPKIYFSKATWRLAADETLIAYGGQKKKKRKMK